jgi:multidrug efflux system membrane fusion protein
MKTSWMAAALLVIILTLWMLSGLFGDPSQEGDATDKAEADSAIMTVEVTVAESLLMAREIELQGHIEPVRHLLLRAQTSGPVEEIFMRKGARVNKDEPLMQLDKGGRMNTFAEATAAVKMARSEQVAAKALREQRLQSQVQLEQAEAALEAAIAQLANITLDIDYTTIKAPFDAIVNDIPIEAGYLVERGDAVVELVDDSAFKVSAQASQQILSELTPGQAITVSLITGQKLTGTLTYISSVADAQTRTFTVEGTVDNPGSDIAAGVSASLHIPVEEVLASFVSPSAMSLDEKGDLGIKALDEEDQVAFFPISLISTSLDGAWVTGIPDGQRVITRGQGFVNVGELVRPQLRTASQPQLQNAR